MEEAPAALPAVEDDYHHDLERLNLFGASAGGLIAAQAVLLATHADYEQRRGVEVAISAGQLRGLVLYCDP
ncbi:alpha/beta hydrolase fold domain-containing protein [Corynebacterium choanae]|uniref:Uncharacterized protein n=1 Tax=Corynebacterium choanae TaxID=1862358 RepID=A0A3G6JBS4_9CORY|nr:alpha/beta hydrolase fold domain-containing protein [Corynebacterium choanae]AZA14120.1 hypothetical protein CCHOA_08655 [Corynebacterium choanae]